MSLVRSIEVAGRPVARLEQVIGGEQWRYGWQRAAVPGSLFETVANLDP